MAYVKDYMKCKYQIEKEIEGWWGTILSLYCTKNCMYLAGGTCFQCENFTPTGAKNETKD